MERGQAEETHTAGLATVPQAPGVRALSQLKLGAAYPKASELRRPRRAQHQGLQAVPGRMWGTETSF